MFPFMVSPCAVPLLLNADYGRHRDFCCCQRACCARGGSLRSKPSAGACAQIACLYAFLVLKLLCVCVYVCVYVCCVRKHANLCLYSRLRMCFCGCLFAKRCLALKACCHSAGSLARAAYYCLIQHKQICYFAEQERHPIRCFCHIKKFGKSTLALDITCGKSTRCPGQFRADRALHALTRGQRMQSLPCTSNSTTFVPAVLMHCDAEQRCICLHMTWGGKETARQHERYDRSAEFLQFCQWLAH
jgi:hypothetical protein